ncbi:MAG TPA: tetratricopeptide repeat protein [Longimicrobiales bacterium]|nr:tetratricopeptide repeat protein [Longimicrobiales bacterium]
MKIRFGLVLTLATGFGLSACAGGASSGGSTPAPAVSGTGGQLLQQGERPRQTEETRAAQRALDQAESTENEAEAKALYEEALTNAQAAIAADSTNPLGHLQAGIAAIGLGRYREADAHLDRAEELRPIYQLETDGMRERAWINLYQEAAPLVNTGDYEGAAAIFEDANAIYDKRPEVMITLGQIYAQLRQTDKSLENLNRAEALINDPDVAMNMDSATVAGWQEQAADIPLTKASVLAAAGRFEEAVGLFEELVADNPTDISLKRNLAAILIQTGDTVRAFEVYDDLMAQPGLSSQDYYAIGVGFYQGSAYERAAEAFKGAADHSPKDRDALEMWTRSLQIDSAYAAVPEPAERWIELDPNNQNAYLILAQAVNQEGDDARASDLVRTIEALEVTVNDLQLVRMADGGARVTGSITNKSLAQGATATMNFTFFDARGNAVGTQTQRISLGAQGMAETFEVVFTSSSAVNGYGYTLTTS